MTKNIFFLTGSFLLLTLLSSCGAKDSETLHIGTNAVFPPFEFLGGTDGNEITGIDIDLIHAILGDSEYEFVNMEFDGLISGIKSGKIDVAASAMTITEARQKSVDFTDPYYEATQAVLVPIETTDIQTKEDLNDKMVAVSIGTTGHSVANDLLDESAIRAFNSGFEAVQELNSGRVDAVIIDNQPAKEYLKKNPNLKVLDLNFDVEYYGLAVDKGNDALLEKLNARIRELKESGELSEIIQKYI